MFAPSTPPATGERLLPTIRPRTMVMQRDFQTNYAVVGKVTVIKLLRYVTSYFFK